MSQNEKEALVTDFIIALFGKGGLMKSRKLTWQAKWFCVGLISLVFSVTAYVVSLAYVNFTK